MSKQLRGLLLTAVLVVSVVASTGVVSVAAQTETGNASVTDYTVSNTTVAVNETLTVTATVENTGDENDTLDVALRVDNDTVDARNVSVASNATATVTFETDFASPGEYEVTVDDLEPTTITVESETEPPMNESGAVTGTVTDAVTGEPISNATVRVADTNLSATTDQSGSYDLADVPLGAHDVQARAEGYDTLEREATVAANETATLDFALSPEEPPVTSDRVDVVIEGAPDGLQTYSVTVSVSETADASITDVESELVSSEKVQVVDRTDDSITIRGADLGDVVGPFDDSRVLATVNLTEDVAVEQVDVTVNQLTADDGSAMDESRVQLALAGVLFVEPLPGSAGDAPPTDPDGDGLYEDIDGDGDADFGDAIALAFVDYGALSDEQRAALDFNGDGELTFADAIELAFQV